MMILPAGDFVRFVLYRLVSFSQESFVVPAN